MENSEKQKDVLLVWDAEGSPPIGNWTCILWRQYADVEDKTVISIAQQVEDNADELRARYLAWVYDIGETKIYGKRIIDHLLIRPGFSYWWMSSLAQKFNISDGSQIDDAIKALALEMLVVTRQVRSIVLVSDNIGLADCVQNMCLARSIDYELRLVKGTSTKLNYSSLYQFLPHIWRAGIYLVLYVCKAIPLFLKNKTPISKHVGNVLFVDVLVHLDKRAKVDGIFISNYWTVLIKKLTDWKIKSNWLHIFFRHPAIPSLNKAWSQINCFNGKSNNTQFHDLVERFISFRILATTLRDYFTIRQSLVRLRGIENTLSEGSNLNLWPLHVEDWMDSICGKEAMINCLRLSLFEEALSRFPPQRLGIYILENQPWEMALVYAWKAAGHGTLIGTPHTTVRFWDLRYHYDVRSYLNCNKNNMPLPDVMAVNGPAALKSILASGYPSERVGEVEALRFLHLLKQQPTSKKEIPPRNGLRVLICGDFIIKNSQKILSWLEMAAASLPHDFVYVFKPHPAYPLNYADYPKMNLEISEAPLGDLLKNFDVVFTSNMTSAAVDAYCSGNYVIQMLDGNTFNTSPLRGLKGVVYVTNPKELIEALSNAKQHERMVTDPYFYLDAGLPRWEKLLSLNELQS